jgi:hypothetical protein
VGPRIDPSGPPATLDVKRFTDFCARYADEVISAA